MKIIVTIISRDTLQIHLYHLFVLSYKPKTKVRFLAIWWPGNEKYFCLLFIASCTLLESHAEFDKLL